MVVNDEDLGAAARQRQEEADLAAARAAAAERQRRRAEEAAREAAGEEAPAPEAAPQPTQGRPTPEREGDAMRRANRFADDEGLIGTLARASEATARDVSQLPGEIAPAVWNGFAGAVNETIDLANEAQRLIAEGGARVMGLENPELVAEAVQATLSESGGTLATRIIASDDVRVPEADAPDSMSGQIVEGIAQFAFGFMGAGKFTKAAGILQGAGRGARFGRAMLNGALADFAAFDGHEARLADLIESSPDLSNPITEFLAADEEDPELVGRLKNTIEGAGMGVLADGVIAGLRAIKGARRARSAGANIQAEEAAADDAARAAIEEQVFSRGAPDGPAITVQPRDVIDIPEAPRVEEPVTGGGRVTRRVVEQRVEQLRAGEAALSEADVDQIVMRADRWAASVERLQPRRAAGMQDALQRFRDDANPDTVEILVDQIDRVRRGMEEPPSLARFLRQNGGVRDPGGELRGMDAGRANLLNNKSGLDPDEAALRAWEAGYFGDVLASGNARPTPNELFELIRRDMSGERVYSHADMDAVLEMAALRDLENELEHMGAPYTSRSTREHREWAQDVADRAPSEPLTLRDFETARAQEEAAGAANGIARADDGGFDIGANRVSLNFNAIQTADDVRSVMGQIADQFSGEVDAARGYRSDRSIVAKAGRTDAWRALEERRAGAPLSDSETLAAQSLYVASAENLSRALRDAAGGGSDMAQYSLRRAMAVHRAIQAEIAGAKADAARALRAWSIPRQATAHARREMEQTLQRYGGAINERDLARLREMAPEVMDRAAVALSKRQIASEAMGALIRFMWLSGPQTHLMNLAGNSLAMTYDIGVRIGSGAWGKLIGDPQLADEMGAAMAEYAGLRAGISAQMRTFLRSADYGRMSRELFAARDRNQSFREFLQQSAAAVWENNPIAATFRGRFDDMGVSGRKFDDVPSDRPVSAQAANRLMGGRVTIKDGTPTADVLNGVGTILSAPTDFLGFQDDFFKGANFTAAIHRQAHQRAMTEVRAGTISREQAQRRIADMIAEPDDAMIEEATRTAQRRTFTEPVGTGTKSVLTLRRWANGLGLPFGHLLVPFITTPSNILKFGFQNSPFGVLFPEMMADIRAGGQRAALAKARMTAGGVMLFTAMDLVANGRVTGAAPSDPGQRALWDREGIQEYSVRVGNRWVSYRRLEPVSTMVAIGADLQQRLGNQAIAEHVDSDTAEIVGPALGAFISIAHSKSYLTSLSEFFQFAEDPERYGANWVERTAASLMTPALAGQFESAVDPAIRATHDIQTRALSRLPGWSDQLPQAYDLWGRPRMMASGLGTFYDAVSPFSVRTYEPEPIDVALSEMAHYPNLPRPAVSVNTVQGAVPVSLSNQQDIYQRYIELSGNGMKLFDGQGARDYLNAVVAGEHPHSVMWRAMHEDTTRPGSRQEFVDRIITTSREAARVRLQQEFGPRLRKLAASHVEAERESGRRAREQAETLQAAMETLAGDQ